MIFYRCLLLYCALSGGYFVGYAEGVMLENYFYIYSGSVVNNYTEISPATSALACTLLCNKGNACVTATYKISTSECLLSNGSAFDTTDIGDPNYKTVSLTPNNVTVTTTSTTTTTTPAAPPSGPFGPSYQGTSFVTGFMSNSGTVVLVLFFVSAFQTNVRVYVPSLTINETFSVLGSIERTYATSLMHTVDLDQATKGVHVESDLPITVYKSNNRTTTLDMTIVLPETALGTNYVILTTPNTGTNMFLIVGTQDNTNVDVTIANVTTPYTLNRLGTLFRLTTGLSGALISASANITVQAGSSCITIPNGAPACDHVSELLPDEGSFGTKFIAGYMYPRDDYSIGIAAKTDGTTVDINDVSGNVIETIIMNRGDTAYRDFLDNTTTTVTTNLGIEVAQYGHGGYGLSPYGDPSMMMIPPMLKYGTSYDFYVAGAASLNVVQVVVNDETLIRINNQVPVYEQKSTVTVPGAGIMVIAHTYITPGKYTITHAENQPFAASLYGGQRDGEFSLSLGWLK